MIRVVFQIGFGAISGEWTELGPNKWWERFFSDLVSFFWWEAFWEKISYEIFKFWARISKGVDMNKIISSKFSTQILLENKDDTYPGYDGGTLYFICIHAE